MTTSRLTRVLYRDIQRLKLLDTDDEENRFRVTKSPFTGDDDVDTAISNSQQEFSINGLIFPKSNLYNERCFEIEMKLTQSFPQEPPTVRFLTEIYHPNVDEHGK